MKTVNMLSRQIISLPGESEKTTDGSRNSYLGLTEESDSILGY